MIEITRLHHASIIVADTGRALAFYRGLLGLKVDDQRPDLGYPGAWLQIGTQQIHLLETDNPDANREAPQHGGRDRHIALTISNLQSLINALDNAGIAYTLSRSGRAALFCRDPDGNALEFIEQA
ncbi:MAG: VOC family protein [Gammaproteobacteria bacterium]|nr:VOC family protein [Gammaproteobacteria bacterium]